MTRTPVYVKLEHRSFGKIVGVVKGRTIVSVQSGRDQSMEDVWVDVTNDPNVHLVQGTGKKHWTVVDGKLVKLSSEETRNENTKR